MHNAERKRRPRDGRECGMFSGGNIGADSRRLRLSINIHYYNAYAPSILCVGAARKVCLNSGKRIRRCRYISSDVAAHDYFKQKRARDTSNNYCRVQAVEFFTRVRPMLADTARTRQYTGV